MKNIKSVGLVCFLIAILSTLSACGTVNGFGKDVSHTGRDIQRAANTR